MDALYPDSYQNENGLQLAGTLKKLFQYTTENAMYNDFDVAYENFVSGEVAMIPNGYWMIDLSLIHILYVGLEINSK